MKKGGVFGCEITWISGVKNSDCDLAGDDGPGYRRLLLHGPQSGLELAQSRRPHLPGPLHLRPLLHPGEPPLARLQRRGGSRLQVNVADQVRTVFSAREGDG